MTTLFDRAARDAIEHDLGRNLFVEAGAGTGKTSALVARVVNLVANGTALPRIAAITFTEAAAAELRERVRAALEATARDDPDERRRASCRGALEVFDDAAITTLHGFANRLLAEHPIEAGLPPGFEVLDEIEAQVELARRFDAFVDAVFADPELERPLVVLTALGFRLGRLEDVARAAHAEWDRFGDWAPPLPAVPETDVSPLLQALDATLCHIPSCQVEDDRLLLHLRGLATYRERLAGAADELDTLEALAMCPRLTSRAGRQEHWGGSKAAVVGCLETAEAARLQTFEHVALPAFARIVAATADFVRAAARDRRDEGRLDFHDLLVLARDVLRHDQSVRTALHERYERLLLDEFQDTDPIQFEIAALVVTDDPDVTSKRWWELDLPAGRLFVVGDPKQSVYRFRRADIALYHQVRERFGDRQLLTQSFRSRPEIVDFVNDLFDGLIRARPDHLQACYEPIGAERPACDHTEVAVGVVGGVSGRDTDLVELRRREAEDLAAVVGTVKRDGWQVSRPFTGASEITAPARYADVAILLPTRQTLPYLEQALEDAGIPVRIESEALVYATADVQDLLSVLAAIDDPSDEIATVAALRSPALACRDDRLVEYAQAGGRFDYRHEPPVTLGADHPVVAGLAALRDHHEWRWWETVSETVERAIRERHMLELAVGHVRPRDHWRRLRFIADAARSFGDAGGTSLRGFVAWLRRQVDEEARAIEVVVPEPDDDAVRILTVHGAKGLEFPIVVLAGLGVLDRTVTGPVLFGADGPEFRVGSGPTRLITPRYEALRATEHEAETEEQLRLLYVAATRARDHLVISLHHRERDQCAAARILARLDPQRGLYRTLPRGARATSRSAHDTTEPIESPGDRDAWLAARSAAITAGARAPVVAATALAGTASDDPDLTRDEPDAERPSWRRGRAGTAVGRAVHAVLQSVDLATGTGIDSTARAQALAEGIPEREHDIAALAASALAAPVVREAIERGWRRWREVPVSAEVDGVLVEGFVDLLLESPDGLVVVDYKTDGVPSEDALDAALDRYAIQGAAYALALETALGRTVARCTFVFARHGAPLERELTGLRDSIGRVRELVASSR